MNKLLWPRLLLLLMLSGISASVFGQHIAFVKGKTWDEVRAAARAADKLIFVDVYTDWCGPCKWMDEHVFTQPDVAEFYNSSFINVKIDAEKGEGIGLKDRYGVKVFPTYLFVDPGSGELVHKSTSRQEKDVFLFTGRSALSRETSSVWMEEAYAKGNRDKQLLRNYAAYLASCYQRDALAELVNTYLTGPAMNLSDTLAWRFFVEYQQGTETEQFRELLANREGLIRQYGKDQVDAKLLAAFEYDLTRLQSQGIYNAERYDSAKYAALSKSVSAIDVEGRDLLLKRVSVLDLFRRKQYSDAADIADGLPGQPGADKAMTLAFYNQLMFYSRNVEDVEWIGRALNYARYIAYNDEENRAKAEIHYNYATMLEKFIRLTDGQARSLPALSAEPVYGEKNYTLRPASLKAKPAR